MNRQDREKDQLIRRFEEVVPFLKTQQKFTYVKSTSPCSPIYVIEALNNSFSEIVLNVETGWHSAFYYFDEDGHFRTENEDTTEVVPGQWKCDYYMYPCPHRGN